MNFHQLKVFYIVAKEKSFSSAARKLFLTQPAVTIQVHLLEDYYGIKLFERLGKSIELTDAGKVLYSYAGQIFQLTNETENVMADFRSLDKGLLKIDTTRTIARYYIPKILAIFGGRYPKVKINLRAGNSREALDCMINFACDIAIVGRLKYPEELFIIPVFEEPLVVITSPTSKVFGKEEIEFRELHKKPLILREEGSAIRKVLLEEYKKEDIAPAVIMEMGNSDALIELVKQDMGFSVLTLALVKDEIRRGSLKVIPLIDKQLSLPFDIIFHRSRESSNLIQVFKDLIFEVLGGSNVVTAISVSSKETLRGG